MKTLTVLPPQSNHPQPPNRNRFQFRPAAALALALLAALLTLWAAPAARAAALTWDAGNTNNGVTIDPASGNWNTTAGNLVWNDAGANVPWTQTSPTAALNTAIFGGADGAVDSYVVTLDSQMAAQTLTFNNTGYKLTGSTVFINPTAAGTALTVAAGKTATINSVLLGGGNVRGITVNAGSVLNLGGGFQNSGSPQFQFGGAGTLNFTGGTPPAMSTGNVRLNVATMNQTGGTVSLAGTSGSGNWIGYSAGRSVNYTISGGSLSLNNPTVGSAAYLNIGRSQGVNNATLAVQAGGTVNIGTTGDGNLYINGNAGDTATAKLDVQGGNLTVGTGNAANLLVFFVSGAPAGKNALMTQSGGTVTANGIQFGGAAGTYDPSALATLQLSGGTNYVGALGIALGSGASTLPYLIQLQGGTLGASVNWSSSLDMKLGTAGGGVTIQAADAANVARNITLSGGIADDTAVNGPLTKTGGGTLTLSGAVSYSGPTVVSAGKLVVLSTATASGAVTNNATLGVTASGTSQWQPASLSLANPCTLEFNDVQNPGTTTAPLQPTAAVGAVSGVTVNVNSISGAVAVGNSYPLLGNQGGTTTGYTLGAQPPGVTGSLSFSGTTLVYVVSSVADIWTGADGTNPTFWDIATTVNWTGKALSNPTPGTYVNGDAVAFDDGATPSSPVTVELQTAVAPGNMLFANITKDYLVTNSGSFGIGGSGTLTKSGAGTVTISCPVSYSGITLVSAGKLVFGSTHSGTGAATVSANAALGVTASGTSQWPPASLTLANPCTLDFNSVTNAGTTTAPLRPTAAVGTVSGVTINIKSLSGAVAIGNSYPLLGNQGGTTNGYALGTQPIGVTGRLAASGTTLVYIVETATDIWTGADGAWPTWWDIGTTANWTGKALINSPAGTYADGDGVLFNDTATPASPVAVELQTAVAPGNMVFSNSSKAYTVSGSFGIDGSGSLTKSGTGTLTLGTDNSYSGTTTVNSAGATTLTVSHNNALGSTAGGTIVYGASATSGDGSRVNLADGITVTDETLTLDAITNGYRVALKTDGTATWDGNVVLTGTGGLITFNANGASANLKVGSSAADTVTGDCGLFIRGTGIGTLNSSIQIGTNGISKADTGIWALAGTNTYSGGTTLGAAGALAILNASALGSGPLNLKSVVTGPDTTLYIDGGINLTNAIIIDSTTGREGITTTTSPLAYGSITLSGPITITGAGNNAVILNIGLSTDPGIGATLAVSNTITATDGFPSAISLRGPAGNFGKIAGVVNAPLMTLEQRFGTDWTITSTGNNWAVTQFGGETGNFVLGANNALATSAPVRWNSADGANALDLAGFNQTVGGLDAFVTPNALVGNSSTTSDSTLTINGGGYTYSGIIADTLYGTGSRKTALTLASGTQTLAGPNTYSGNTTVNGGTLAFALASIATSSTVSVASGAVLQLDFAETNAVAGFVTNGVSLPPGVYNAANATPFITGIGSLEVVSVAPPQPTIAPVTVSGTDLVVTVPTISGLNYVLQSATNLTPTINWQNESTNAGDGLDLILNVPIEPGKPQKFLRFWLY